MSIESTNLPYALVVDDELSYLSAMSRVFRGKFRVFTAENLTAARRLLRQHEDKFAFMLVDLHLKDNELGTTFLEEVRRTARRRIPFFIMTGSIPPLRPEILQEKKSVVPECDADGILEKPFDNEELLRLIREFRIKISSAL